MKNKNKHLAEANVMAVGTFWFIDPIKKGGLDYIKEEDQEILNTAEKLINFCNKHKIKVLNKSEVQNNHEFIY